VVVGWIRFGLAVNWENFSDYNFLTVSVLGHTVAQFLSQTQRNSQKYRTKEEHSVQFLFWVALVLGFVGLAATFLQAFQSASVARGGGYFAAFLLLTAFLSLGHDAVLCMNLIGDAADEVAFEVSYLNLAVVIVYLMRPCEGPERLPAPEVVGDSLLSDERPEESLRALDDGLRESGLTE
jgi:hypothetical protein